MRLAGDPLTKEVEQGEVWQEEGRQEKGRQEARVQGLAKLRVSRRSVQSEGELNMDTEERDTEEEDKMERSRKKKCSSGLGYSKSGKKPKLSSEGEAEMMKSRQAKAGEKLRRKNAENKNAHMAEIVAENLELKKLLVTEQRKRKAAEVKFEATQAKEKKRKLDEEEDEAWLQTVLGDMTKDARKSFKLSLFSNRASFKPGRITKLRRSTGINFSRAPTEAKMMPTPLAEKIREFAEDNSKEMPDTKANKPEGSKEPDRRSALHHLSVLHYSYLMDHPENQCSYTSFCRNWPSNVIKPSLSDYTSCHCIYCENASMIMASLVTNNIVPETHNVFLALKQDQEDVPDLKASLINMLEAVKEGPRKEEKVTFKTWEKIEKETTEDDIDFRKTNAVKSKSKKVLEKRMKVASVLRLSELAKSTFKELEEHLNRVFQIKTFVNQKMQDIAQDKSGEVAAANVDWNENIEIRQDREIQSAYFDKKTFSLHTTYVTHNSRSFGVGSLGEGSDHKVCIFFLV